MSTVSLAARRSAWTLRCSAQRNVPPYYVDTVWIYVTVDPVGSAVLYNKQRRLCLLASSEMIDTGFSGVTLAFG